MERLHPGARWFFRFYGYLFTIFVMLFSLPFVMAILKGSGNKFSLFFMVLYLLIFLIVPEIYARLSYNNWKFELTKNNLKIEKGIIWKRYSDIPYKKIQNIDIHRGIIARMFGFSTINVQTAGYSGHYSQNYGMSEGHIPAIGLKRAEEIRKFLMKR